MIILDASVWVSMLLPFDRHHQASWELANHIRHLRISCSVPALFLAEVAGAVARRSGDLKFVSRAVDDIIRDPSIAIVPVDMPLAQRAASVAGRSQLRGADAHYAALAQRLKAHLVTWDQELLERASMIVQVMTPVAFMRQPDPEPDVL